MKSITILCSNLKGNLGDFAIAEAVAVAAKRHLGDCRVHLYHHANKRVDQDRLTVMLSETNADFDLIQPGPYYRRPWWLRSFCRSVIAPRLYSKWHNSQINRVARLISSQEDFVEQLRESDLVVFAGGAQWGRGDLNMNMFAQLKAAASVNKRVCAFPFSVSGGLVACNGKEALAEFYAHLCRPVLVRDAISHDTLQSVGVDAKLICDSVFSLKGEFDISWKLQGHPPDRQGIVFISLTQSGSPSLQSVIDMLDSLKSRGLKPVLFSNCEVEDRPFYDSIQETCEVEAVYPASWKQAVAQLAEARFVITNRLHCLIFSALSATPVVPVTNRLKTEAYVADAGLPCSLKAARSISPEQIDSILSQLEEISAKQAAYAEACATMLDEGLKRLFEVENG